MSVLARRLLQFLSSLHLGIILIGLVAAACIAGSLIASNDSMGVEHGRQYVFHTWWFLGLMGLLLINLCLCSWEKSYIALTLYKKKNFQRNPKFYEKSRHSIAMPWKGTAEQLETVLKKRYTVTASSSGAFYSQKGLFGRTGATIIHLGLLWTMMAGFIRILADPLGWGVYDSTIILPEGQATSNYVTRRDRLAEPSGENLVMKTMPFSVRGLDFHAEYFPHSTVAKSFASLVEVSDGDFRKIYEVTMTEPIMYKGYKLTQNSFNNSDRVQRGQFRITDNETGRFTEVDTIPGDPVRIRNLTDEPIYFQTDALSNTAHYYIMDLVKQEVIEEGKIVEPEKLPLPIDTRPFAQALRDSRYSVMVAALFPNFIFDENNQPTTQDENFTNPAVLVMLFKNGQSNGYLWLFHNPEAQAIIGQPHPEVDLVFKNYQEKTTDTVSSQQLPLYRYEVELEITEKGGLGAAQNVWLSAGQLHEVPVSERVMQRANVRMDRLTNAHIEETTTTEQLPEGLAQRMESATATTETVSTSTDDAATTQGRYQVDFLGVVPGHVTFLGFMKDPSVGWVFAGCIVIILGTLIAFIFVYREVWCYFDESTGMLYMATAVRGTSAAAHREFDRLVNEIKMLA